MAGDGSKKGNEASSVPPRKINVQKFAESRASELETLHSIVSNRLNNDFTSRRNKRRRTTSFDNQAAKKRHRKKRKFGIVAVNKRSAADAAAVSDQEKIKVPPRRIRRRVELRKNPGSGFSTSGDGTKRLRTHIWHAKRFTMTKLWGFHLPLGLQGRGRGSRALLKWYKHGAVMHDASYCSALQLEGHEDALTSVLKMVLEPSPSAQSEEITNATVSGAIYGSAMLHHVGAPISQLIAPVTYMWQPIHLGDEENSGHEYKSGGCNSPQSSESCSHRRLWVWIHASAFSEAYDVLKFACQKQMNESGILINCFSLEGQLAKLEVMGSKAFQLLQKILHPVSCTSNNSGTLKTCAAREADPELKKPSLLQIDENVSPCSILCFNVRDPRALLQKRIADIHLAVPTAVNSVPDCKAGKDVAVSGSLDKVEALGSPSCSKPEGDSNLFNNMNLWDARSRVTLPVEENVLCLEKHHLHMDFICLDDPKSRTLSSSTEVQRSCPIMLLKNNNQMGSFMGWSIIVPLSWVRVFWISLISKGAHAIGLREKQWVACEVGLPIFPADFPDSNGYWSSMETVNTTLDQKAEQQPPAVRLSKVPIPPPWTSVRVSVDKGLFAVQGTSICSVKDMVDCNLSSNSRCEISNNTSTTVSNLFNGIIARTSLVLTDFLKEVDGCHLLLFPQVPNGKMRFAELMMDENRCAHIQNGSSVITYDRKLCFVRVLLHAYKEGVFEEGAIICAPCPSDVSLLTSRSEEGEAGLQIPESSVRSYFTEQASGKWELQLPESSIAARESYRWPIGFVTTGFVRGSKKPVAEALCEAVVLAGLREEQWNATAVKHRKKEIYVLVRNMRSSKYRLGLASIVLEQQEDLEFL